MQTQRALSLLQPTLHALAMQASVEMAFPRASILTNARQHQRSAAKALAGAITTRRVTTLRALSRVAVMQDTMETESPTAPVEVVDLSHLRALVLRA